MKQFSTRTQRIVNDNATRSTPRTTTFSRPLPCPLALFFPLLKGKVPQAIVAEVKSLCGTWVRLEQERDDQRFMVLAGNQKAGQMAFEMLEKALLPFQKDLELSRQAQDILKDTYQEILVDENDQPLDFKDVAAKLTGRQHRNLNWFRWKMCNLLWKILGDLQLSEDLRNYIADNVYDHVLRIEFRDGQCRVTAPRRIFVQVREELVENAAHVRAGRTHLVECPREKESIPAPAHADLPSTPAVIETQPAVVESKVVRTFVPKPVPSQIPVNIFSLLGDECEA